MATENKIIKDDPNEFKSQPKDFSKLAKLYDNVSILARSMEKFVFLFVPRLRVRHSR